MKTDPEAVPEPAGRQPEPADAALENRLPRCEEIQAVLVDYMTRELGPARSALVREHLRKCPFCQTAAADIQATFELLRQASGADDSPEHLSDDRRARIHRAVMHPLMHWIERHHVLVSLAAALVLVTVLFVLLRHARLWVEEQPRGIPVRIGWGQLPDDEPVQAEEELP